MSIWRRILGYSSPSVPEPALGRLHVVDDDDVVHVYAVTCAEYNIYQDEGLHWLTLLVAADQKITPEDEENPEPFLELNLHFDESPESDIRPGKLLTVPSYHEELSNLTNMYYFTHRPFDGEVLVEAVTEAGLTARVSGESDDDPVVLRADFLRNPELRRSFS